MSLITSLHNARLLLTSVVLALGGMSGAAAAAGPESAASLTTLERGLNLAKPRVAQTRYYVMETSLIHFEQDGTRLPGAVFTLYLQALPPSAEHPQERFVCHKLTLQQPGRSVVELPTLGGWSYSLGGGERGVDDKGQVFGIPHEKFAMLVDSRGELVNPEIGYLLYNAFIDFHALNDVFAGQSEEKGIACLHRFGDVIEHSAANSVAPVGLGDAVKQGSEFRNGAITLELKGVSMVNGVACALIGYDSGESSYLMYLEPMAGLQTKAEGASHYFGDLYLELDSKWLRKGTLHEFVVSQVTPGAGAPQPFVIERTISLETASKADFDQLGKKGT